jgi:1,4-dihydroxy-2-naphthoate octaprenyltransferase
MTLATWYQTLRPYSFPASLVPVFIAPAVALYDGVAVDWVLFPVFLVAALALHAGTNVLNDYYDYVNGVDREGVADAAGVIVNRAVTPRFMGVSGHVYFAIGAVLSVVLAVVQGWEILAVAVVGGGLAYLYTGKRISLKYYATGDVLVFLLLGPAMSGAAFYAITGTIAANPVYSGIMPGLLVTIILEANNIRDLESDRAAAVRTVAGMLGRRGTVVLYLALVVLVYAVVVVQWLIGWASPLALAVFASLPIAVAAARLVVSAPEDRDVMGGAVMRSAKLESLFGLLYVLSFVAAWAAGL